MGHQVIRQPDGRMAIWSTVTDSLIYRDLDKSEVESFFVTGAIERARERVRKTLKAVEAGKPETVYHQFAITWEEAVRASDVD